ncbi:hypothetical protein [Lichenifustis flavocetrariae]|uniref:Uncharacterized protein n=1 Tax=Lichenifustis flavocetrariae TaxID=2949735 RepID=A0AA41Z657_9HYPH|nr:hypothetical protein [Lichenifustis flavocetrariae]MCW6511050.1 hypothetical protein [Lichenifustis flavocetrariae]
MIPGQRTITIDQDFQGGLTLSASGVKNGLLAAIELGLVTKSEATEILLLIREATQQLMDTMAQ